VPWAERRATLVPPARREAETRGVFGRSVDGASAISAAGTRTAAQTLAPSADPPLMATAGAAADPPVRPAAQRARNAAGVRPRTRLRNVIRARFSSCATAPGGRTQGDGDLVVTAAFDRL
jgi:hypothetical protein